VRVTSGLYEGDLALVEYVEDNKCLVKLVPRVAYESNKDNARETRDESENQLDQSIVSNVISRKKKADAGASVNITQKLNVYEKRVRPA